MTELLFKPIIIVSNWKAGGTLFQYLLARDDNIQNIFPNKEKGYNDIEGKFLWRKYYDIVNGNKGNCLPKDVMNYIPYDELRGKLNEIWDGKSEYVVIKRPQFLFKLDFVENLFPENRKIIALKRKTIPIVYSHWRERHYNNILDRNIYFGIKPPKWRDFIGKDILETHVWQNLTVNKVIEDTHLFSINYSDLCDFTTSFLYDISAFINYDIDIEVPKLTNFNYEYLTGTSAETRRFKTVEGKFEQEKSESISVPPFTKRELSKIKRYVNKYRELYYD